jgi:hypothetical protein
MTTLILQLNQVEELLCSDLTVDRLFCPTQQKNFLSFYSKSLNNHLLVTYMFGSISFLKMVISFGVVHMQNMRHSMG